MTVVVADTSPLNYLILIEHIDLLPRLYRRIIIPVEVLRELNDDGAPRRVSEWAMQPPEWLEVRSTPPNNDPALSLLDQGERCAILLAQSEADVLLLIDEAAGRLPNFQDTLGRTNCRGCSQKTGADSVATSPNPPQSLIA